MSSDKKEKRYYRELNTLITQIKPRMNIIMDNYNDPIGTYIIQIDAIIKRIASDYEINKLYNSVYLLKSYLSLLLHFYHYEPNNDGKLLGNSSNCQFTIANVTDNHHGKDYKIFVKIIQYSKQNTTSTKDLLIYDIVSAIVFDKIFSTDTYKIYKDFIPVYKGSCLSYIRHEVLEEKGKLTTKDFWNFNEIKDFGRKGLTFFDPYILQQDITRPIYNDPVIIAMHEAIDYPISVMDVFRYFNETESNASDEAEFFKAIHLVNLVISNAYDMYKFLEMIGTEYGFMHNDLHFSNIILDQTKNKLVIIDFGRCCFSKFIHESNIEINNKLLTEFKKLNYNIGLKKIYLTDDSIVNKFAYLYEKNLFRFNVSIKDTTTNKYFGIIYDLITYSLNMYIKILYFSKIMYPDFAIEIEENFKLLIKINYTYDPIKDLIENSKIRISNGSLTLHELMTNYKKIKEDFVTKITDTETFNFYTMILNGLFYASLLFHFIIKKYGENKLYEHIWYYFQIKNVDLTEFYDFIQTYILSNESYVEELKNDTFLMQFVKKEESSVSGGFATNSSRSTSISKYKNTSVHTPFKLNYISKIQEMNDKIFEFKSMYNNPKKYFSLFSKPVEIKSAHKTTMDETSKAYEKIYNEKELCDLKVNNTTIKSLPAKRSLRNYKSQPNRSSI